MTRLRRAASRRAPMPCAFLLSLFASTALAQTAPAPNPADTVADVVVVGQKPAVKSSIDRKTYNVTRDLAGASGSVSDVLRNLPSVEVDIEGNVSLRGDGNVTILIDGQPSIALSGSSRAQALQQMSASGVDTIEVMTNPSAEYPPDGTAGIINIVTRKVRKAGTSGSVQVGVGTPGRWNASATVAAGQAPMNVNAALRLRRDASASTNASSMTRVDPVSRAVTRNDQSGGQQSNSRGFALSVGADYDVTPQDRLSASLSLNGDEGTRVSTTTELRTNAVGAIVSDYEGLSINPYELVTFQASTNWRHAFAEKGRLFTLAARYSGQTEDNGDRLTYLYRSPAGVRIEQRNTVSDNDGLTLSGAYTMPLSDGGTLKSGYDLSVSRSVSEFRGALVQPDGSFIPLVDVNNRFEHGKVNHQAWFTWQKPLGKLTALGGLRLESDAIDFDQVTSGVSGDDNYLQVHPSLHLQYTLTETQNLTASYSHRISRPQIFQLNPFVRYIDDFNATAGNPALRPQEVHSVELEWERQAGLTLTANLNMRRYYNMIGDVERFLTPTVLLRTYENQGTATSGGLDLTASGKVGDDLSYRLNGTVAYSELQRPSSAGSTTRAAFSGGVRANLDWKATDADLFQLTGSWAGRQPTAQGYRKPGGVLNFGYRRKLGSDLVAVLTVSDVFETVRRESVADLPLNFGVSTGTGIGRTFMFSLTRQLGGKPVRDAGFEYVN